ncbi:hypothetical protein WJX74_009730 [Apatococcus lobatus]|uniref:Uncharacterized protein n=1 Tax=Apatococcus lobatus TaxID=904363 RepID=A0AAW1RH94_9CHLO
MTNKSDTFGESCFKAAAELSGTEVEFELTDSKNIAVLQNYIRTGKVSGASCSSSPREVIHDLIAWSVPQEKWPESLQIMVNNVQWWDAVEESLKVNLEAALKAWRQDCPNQLLRERQMIANIRMDANEVEVMHWEKFKDKAGHGDKMVFPVELPVPSVQFKERIGRSFPGTSLEWNTLDNGRHDGYGRPASFTKQAIGILISVSPVHG